MLVPDIMLTHNISEVSETKVTAAFNDLWTQIKIPPPGVDLSRLNVS
jgi:hypothetical protein